MQTWIRANVGKLIARFGGMALKLISAADYAALEVKNPATLYTVTDSEADTVGLYLGGKFIIGDRVSTIGTTSRAAIATVNDISGTIPAVKKKRKRRSK